ncbi:MAG TPA: 4-(cytidine 5'-diphospho)-2-C-methyl-D-erythritol kinase [Candidatus Krumholzibacteria bacterium]|nr:4-(cytidine 5'-diphospho)-2-C-methyl-D-erythritol kinase [Candidatus Krumholzibacteria bacterium]HRX50087.1 4-(cytidine 5'-diphospho)-2-C-methyl-D-erythritol kinase [Candidatus Krumholzibacteria bacterium]
MNGHGVKAPRRRVALRSPAKVNLHLEVLFRRPDGYHEIETILQAVTLFDRLEVELADVWEGREPRLDLAVEPFGSAPEDATNLVHRAAALFCERTGRSGHLRLHLRKEIPSEAGLGGGSGNAAAALLACDRLFGTRLGVDELEALGAELGSDVPFFIRGGTQLARGRGTDLTPLSPVRRCHFLIVKPKLSLSTAAVYDRLNLGLTTRAPKVSIRNAEALIARFPAGSWFGTNRLEEVVLPDQPALQRLLLDLREQASVALLAGSGSAIFGAFADDRTMAGIEQRLAADGWDVRRARPHPAGVVFTDE